MAKDEEKDPEENGYDGLAEGPEGDQPMSFWDHMSELRKRLIWAVGSVLVGFMVAIGFVGVFLPLLPTTCTRNSPPSARTPTS